MTDCKTRIREIHFRDIPYLLGVEALLSRLFCLERPCVSAKMATCCGRESDRLAAILWTGGDDAMKGQGRAGPGGAPMDLRGSALSLFPVKKANMAAGDECVCN